MFPAKSIFVKNFFYFLLFFYTRVNQFANLPIS